MNVRLIALIFLIARLIAIKKINRNAALLNLVNFSINCISWPTVAQATLP